MDLLKKKKHFAEEVWGDGSGGQKGIVLPDLLLGRVNGDPFTTPCKFITVCIRPIKQADNHNNQYQLHNSVGATVLITALIMAKSIV